MFIYLLIFAELAVLFTVFWYLYVREPKCNHRIKGVLWGAYDDDEFYTTYGAGRQHNNVQNQDETAHRYASVPESEWSLPSHLLQEELVLDPVKNRYIPIGSADEGHSFLVRLAMRLDRTLSQLNVRP